MVVVEIVRKGWVLDVLASRANGIRQGDKRERRIRDDSIVFDHSNKKDDIVTSSLIEKQACGTI